MGFKIDRVYTKTGDGGETGLVGGTRVAKDAVRIEAYGTVDELNAVIGMVRVAVRGAAQHGMAGARAVEAALLGVQQQLFNLGSELATPPAQLQAGMPVVDATAIAELEHIIDQWNSSLKPLTSFVLPGGGEVSGWAHLARTICRRAERRVVTLRRAENQVRAETAQYLNRLGDWLFVLARYVAAQTGEAETLWDKTRR